jgi:hypothetical protein
VSCLTKVRAMQCLNYGTGFHHAASRQVQKQHLTMLSEGCLPRPCCVQSTPPDGSRCEASRHARGLRLPFPMPLLLLLLLLLIQRLLLPMKCGEGSCLSGSTGRSRHPADRSLSSPPPFSGHIHHAVT